MLDSDAVRVLRAVRPYPDMWLVYGAVCAGVVVGGIVAVSPFLAAQAAWRLARKAVGR